jgi:antitoxin CptB
MRARPFTPPSFQMDVRMAKLRWRSRRGMRELDAVLLGFLDTNAAALSEAEFASFELILELPDPVLYGYLLGRSDPTDAATAALVERIRSSPPAQD